MTDVIRVDPADPEAEGIERAAACLRAGGLVAFPTETVYGLGVHALDRDAVRRLFEAKGRPANDPLIVHVASFDLVSPLVLAIPAHARALADRFWPGPLTLVMRRSALVPDDVTAGLDTVAVRVPAHPVARALLRAAAVPVAAPSANLFSRPSPTQASHVLDDLNGRIDLVVDGGATTVGVESTVLDLSRDVPTVLRFGATTIEMLREVVPEVAVGGPVSNDRVAMTSPGMLSKHYAPRTPLTLYEGRDALTRLVRDASEALAAGHRVGVLAAEEDRPALAGLGGPGLPAVVRYLGMEHDSSTVAASLYAALRELDASGVSQILARGFPPGEGLGLAIQDRLRRAAVRLKP